MKLVKKRPLVLSICLFFMLGLLSMEALAADSGSHIYVGGVELTGSADEPAYAKTDESGKVTPGGSEDNYNVKWDGATLTLNDANVTGGYSYVDSYGDPNCAAIYRDGTLAIALVGENTVTGPDSDGELNNGIVSVGDLEISGSGSVAVTSSYDGITSQVGNLTILGGRVMAEGGSCGISTYDGDLTISGGEVTATATGGQFSAATENDLSYGLYIYGNCNISGGKMTATAHADSPYITTACGIFVFGAGGLTISGGELTASTTGDNGNRFGIDSFYGAVIKDGTVTATGGYAGIFTHSRDDGDITIEGGTVTATGTDENGYGIYARTNVIIKGGTVAAAAGENGGYGVYAAYGDVAIEGGTINATGEAGGLASQDGDVTVVSQEGWQIAMTAGVDKDSAAAVNGSPFGTETAISDMLDGMKYVSVISRRDGLPFTDVAEDSWYYDAVDYVYTAGLMSGTDDSTFGPNMAASRSTVTDSLWRMSGSPVVNYLMDFTDVDPEAGYGEAIRWAASEGIAGGYGGKLFGPDAPVTWEQLAVMLWRYAGSADAADISSYTDSADVSEWAWQAMAWCVEQGIIGGETTSITLAPQGKVTRAQIAVILQKFCQLG